MISYVFWHENGGIRDSKHSGIFWAELVTKKVVLGSSGTYFMYMRVKMVYKSAYDSKSGKGLKILTPKQML